MCLWRDGLHKGYGSAAQWKACESAVQQNSFWHAIPFGMLQTPSRQQLMPYVAVALIGLFFLLVAAFAIDPSLEVALTLFSA